MDAVGLSSLSLTISAAAPLSVTALIMGMKIRGYYPIKHLVRFIAGFATALSIAAFINALIGISLSTWYVSGGKYPYTYYLRHECCWVALGLSIGAFVFGLIALLSTLKVRRLVNSRIRSLQTAHTNPAPRLYSQQLEPRDPVVSAQPQQIKPVVAPQPQPKPLVRPDCDYIEEIRRLKELLDCQALTQEEFDARKKEILSRK